jgi:fatty acid desaturase
MCRGRLADDPVARAVDSRLLAVEVTAAAAFLIAWAVTGLAPLLIGVALAAYVLWRQDWLREIPLIDAPDAADRELVGSSR